MYTESKTPWWSYLMLITPVVLIPVGIQTFNKAEAPRAKEQVLDGQPLEAIVEENQQEELSGTGLVVVLVFIALMAGRIMGEV